MNLRDEDAGDEFTLNLTPMIDVIFQLLLFFMVATTFQDPEREIDIELPQAQSGSALESELEELVINVQRDGTLVLSGEVVSKDALASRLSNAAQQNSEMPVTIRGDKLVHHEDIVGVMDACGVAGLTALSLGTMETR
ncbi:MAG: biopolymer transport protein ExbD [Planctomycetota bacterium]|jgi:biopolymer transport protein ExbD